MEIAEEHVENYPWTLLVLRLTAGREYAQMVSPKQKVLFPTDLLEVWSTATINGEPMPNVPEMNRFWSAFQQALKNSTSGRQPVDEALKVAADRIAVK